MRTLVTVVLALGVLASASARAEPPLRFYSKGVILKLKAGTRREGVRSLRASAQAHGVALSIRALRPGVEASEYGIRYRSPSLEKMAAFEKATFLRDPAPEMAVRPTGRSMRLGVYSEKNLREENQDVFEQATSARGDLLFLVFDGAGGLAGGRLAARRGADDVRRHFVASDGDAMSSVRESLAFANRENLRVKRSGRRIGASTAVGVVITKEGRLVSANLGDSRAYRYSPRSQRLEQLTRDHNGAEDNVITQYLGKESGFRPDVTDHGRIERGERILISSDGLHKFVSDAVIRRELARNDVSLDRIAANLAAIAKRNGSDDNITLHLYEHP